VTSPVPLGSGVNPIWHGAGPQVWPKRASVRLVGRQWRR